MRQQRVKTKSGTLKEIRLRLKIDDHDLEVKVQRAIKFLDKKNKIRLSIKLSGRENLFRDRAILLLKKFVRQAGAQFETQPALQGNIISAILVRQKS